MAKRIYTKSDGNGLQTVSEIEEHASVSEVFRSPRDSKTDHDLQNKTVVQTPVHN